MQFNKTQAVPQLYVAVDNGSATPGTLLYLLPQNTAKPPATITFAESWSSCAGWYIFLEQPLAAGTEAAFAASAWMFLADPRMVGTRFVWFNPPDGSGLLTGTPIPVYEPDPGAGFKTEFPAALTFRNVALLITANTPIAADEANSAFTLTQQGTQAIYLTSNWGAVRINAVVSNVTLPFTGPLAGCVQFTLQLTLQNLADLDVGLRYFYAVPPDLQNPDEQATDFFLGSLRYPIFSQGLTLYANLDPLAPLNGARTFLAFNGADAGQPSSGAAPAVGAYLNSTMGDSFSLLPLTGSAAPTAFAALVLAQNRQSSAASPHDPFYLVPRGDYALQTTRKGTVNLMCGLSGVEYVALGDATNIISFFPGNAAFAAGFFPGKNPGYGGNLKPSVAPTTSFVSVTVRSGALDYFAQPDQSVLYNYDTQPIPGVTAITPLSPVPVQAATIPWPPAPSLVFPMLPYSGLGQDLATYQQMETQIVSPVRRLALTPAPPRPAAGALTLASPASKYSTTPQGLLATYTPGSSVWDEIILAQMGATAQQFLLTGVQGKLLSAFQSNKLFLVVSDPASIQSFLQRENALITVGSDPTEPWNFDLAPDAWSKVPNGTILIVKFYDMSIHDLAGQTSTWAFAGDFNTDAAKTSKTILDIINAADPSDADLATFLNAVTNPNWNGILILNAEAPITNLPPQLAGLAAGIDQTRFFAHHVGINASKITVPAKPGDLSISDSSIFGLINYQAPAPLQSGGGDYQFQVEQLRVLFLNSDVASFSSIVNLQVNTLFGELATLAGSNNIVRMYGVYQKQVVNGLVHESYSFQTRSGQTATFDMTSNVLNAVQISKGQFVTVNRPWSIAAPAASGAVRSSGTTTITTTSPHTLAVGDEVNISAVADSSFDGLFKVASAPSPTSFTFLQPGQPDATSGNGNARPTKTDSQFVFWGLLDFKTLDNFDVFSFGRESGETTPSGLSFGNLVIEMTFDSAASSPDPQFTFDASQLAFDLAGSTARKKSFFNHFPLTVGGFTQAKQSTTPAGLGYMSVQTPLTQSSLSYPWFSLNFNLNLGSPGALAAQAGFVATYTAAWSPNPGNGSTNYKVFTGLKLPGSSGAKRAISIEGIFNITFKTLEIIALPAANTYILVLYNIGFKFLSFTFPPNGQVNFVLFGDPNSTTTGDTSLGWYAAYAKAQANTEKQPQAVLPNAVNAALPAATTKR